MVSPGATDTPPHPLTPTEPSELVRISLLPISDQPPTNVPAIAPSGSVSEPCDPILAQPPLSPLGHSSGREG
ncbi:hypothetical protein PCANC_02866 [Puccinia coronata f. sp. avenae]|uniref:Uncharacterized protein n=1 Tax=Puccinia coronata f. sp. avenae TaxID=200324 RepID=A0A2N5W424_9BASI|nr:hypothetical protein PCANC_02866 [Puccinia coronata f. sp. avenae]